MRMVIVNASENPLPVIVSLDIDYLREELKCA